MSYVEVRESCKYVWITRITIEHFFVIPLFLCRCLFLIFLLVCLTSSFTSSSTFSPNHTFSTKVELLIQFFYESHSWYSLLIQPFYNICPYVQDDNSERIVSTAWEDSLYAFLDSKNINYVNEQTFKDAGKMKRIQKKYSHC